LLQFAQGDVADIVLGDYTYKVDAVVMVKELTLLDSLPLLISAIVDLM
jgi:hypothetical protein